MCAKSFIYKDKLYGVSLLGIFTYSFSTASATLQYNETIGKFTAIGESELFFLSDSPSKENIFLVLRVSFELKDAKIKLEIMGKVWKYLENVKTNFCMQSG